MRLPLATDMKTAISDHTVGERLFNALTEKRGDAMKVKKRPGALATGWNFTTPIQGLLGGSLLYLIYDDTFELVDVDNPPSEVLIGDLVGGYYAMIDNPPTAPGPGDDYWSASPPGSTRYKSAMTTNFSGSSSKMHPLGSSPWDLQIQGSIGASQSATIKSLQASVDSVGGVLAWDGTSLSAPPVGAVLKYLPVGMTYSGTNVTLVGPDYYSFATVDWSAGYVPSEIPAATTPASGPGFVVGTVRSQTISSGVTITSTGAVAKIDFSALSVDSVTAMLFAIRHIEVSGADQPEYNGTFDVFLTPNSLAIPEEVTFYHKLYYTMTGIPAASTATGTVVVKHFM
ncbi:hypothetical protein UFOVP935_11 [uncultured Caudovirales phage]|uniref:Uncharacterized protein n=1 Tax=uncultured Caudovirales phage TaxID=2100421 RepID=A0A6J5PTP8_9CAUD|nr:hypothetical protein UFOVP935_11 [uncultured Caudovirales phage]